MSEINNGKHNIPCGGFFLETKLNTYFIYTLVSGSLLFTYLFIYLFMYLFIYYTDQCLRVRGAGVEILKQFLKISSLCSFYFPLI